LPSIPFHLSTGRAQRREARTGAKRLDFCTPQWADQEIGFQTIPLLKALQNANKKHQKNPVQPKI